MSATSSDSPHATGGAASLQSVDYFSLTHPLDVAGNGRRVLVTGAAGFIAGHIVQILLARGYRVRGTVRNLQKTGDVQYLRDLETKVHAQYPVELVQADLLKDEGWKEAIDGCEIVLHTASPFTTETDEEKLIKPAVNGTLCVLRGAAECPSVRRVVVTSSVASISNSIVHDNNHEYDESEWSNLTVTPPYQKSKTLAEREAWRFYDRLHGTIGGENKAEQKGDNSDPLLAAYKYAADEWKDSYTNKFEMCTICPSFVQGPLLSSRGCTSEEFIKRLLTNDVPGIPNFGFTVVDVRDVALAHVRAMNAAKEDADRQRFIVSGEFAWAQNHYAPYLAEEFDANGYTIPKMKAPNFVLRVVSLWDSGARAILPELSKKIAFRNDKSKKILGMNYIPARQAILAMAYSLIELGMVDDHRKRNPVTKKVVHYHSLNGVKQCSKCSKAFSLFQRPYHCHCCGGVFCSTCTAGKVANERACSACVEKYNSNESAAAAAAATPKTEEKAATAV